MTFSYPDGEEQEVAQSAASTQPDQSTCVTVFYIFSQCPFILGYATSSTLSAYSFDEPLLTEGVERSATQSTNGLIQYKNVVVSLGVGETYSDVRRITLCQHSHTPFGVGCVHRSVDSRTVVVLRVGFRNFRTRHRTFLFTCFIGMTFSGIVWIRTLGGSSVFERSGNRPGLKCCCCCYHTISFRLISSPMCGELEVDLHLLKWIFY